MKERRLSSLGDADFEIQSITNFLFLQHHPQSFTMAPSRASPIRLLSIAQSPTFSNLPRRAPTPPCRSPTQCLRQLPIQYLHSPRRSQQIRLFMSNSSLQAGTRGSMKMDMETAMKMRGKSGSEGMGAPSVLQANHMKDAIRDMPTDIGLIQYTYIHPRSSEKKVMWSENWRHRLQMERYRLKNYWYQLGRSVQLDCKQEQS